MPTLAIDTEESITDKYQAARNAQPAWAARPLEERMQCIAKFGELLIEKSEDLARLLSKEMGKPITQARSELKATPERVHFFLENTSKVLEPKQWPKIGDCLEEISYEPLGVIANISAWNYPYFVSSNVFLPALLCGNTVLFKPSEYVPRTGLATAELLHEAGVPKDCFVPVIGSGVAGQDLIDQPIDAVFFTGSHTTGQAIAKHMAGRLVPVQLELGGNDPVYVASQTKASKVAGGKFFNAGQSCCAVERIYVHESFYESFVEDFVKEAEALVLGDPMSEETTLGPLAREQQIDYLDDLVEDALAKGAKLLTGGQRADLDGAFYEPTVLAKVDHSMRLMREECFGPIVGIQSVATDQEAIDLMNDSTYGLTAAVYCDDEQRARKILGQLHVGSVYWNCCDRVSPRLPWSGRRGSGLGSTLSEEGIRAFVQPKAWHLRC